MLTFDQFYRSVWFRPAFAIVVLAAAAAFGYLSVRYDPYLVLLVASAPLVALGLDWILRRLHWIPPVILIAATLTSWDVSKGLTVALIAATGFTVLWLLRQVLVTRQTEFASSPVILSALAFALVALLSYGWSQIASDPFLVTWGSFPFTQLGQLAIFVFSPFVLIMTASLITHTRHLKYLIYTFLIVTLIGGLAEFLMLPVRLNMRGMVYTWVACLAFGQLLYNRTASHWQRGLSITLLAIWFAVSFLRGITWVSGWLPGMFAMVILTFFKSKRLFLLLLLIAIVLGVGASAWVGDRYIDEYNESGGTRLYRWQTLFEQPFVWNHWLLGMGPAGYARYFMTYIPTNAMSTHSNYIDILLQLGILGMVILLWLLGTLAWIAFKLQRISIRDPFVAAFARSTLAMPIVVLLAMFLGDWFTPFVYNQGLIGFSWTINSWIFLGALTAIPKILARETGNRSEESSVNCRE
ncbi:MAG: O-antigen ligase family protein [Chloroflexi bacterium]|nr:O-antigen ligase family protein [Chloroflexota bacterium]